MKEYHKINTVFKRDPTNKMKTLLLGDYALPEFEYLKNNEWIFTEKVDGTNIRVMFATCSEGDKKYSITFGGKTDNAQIPAPLVERLQTRFLTDQKQKNLQEIFPEGNVCLYGEGYGARIQKGGGNYRPDVDFVLFDVKIDDWWLLRPNVEDIAAVLKLDIVPVIGTGTLGDMVQLAEQGFDSKWGKFPAEGIVAYPTIGLRTRRGNRIITKIKHKDFQ